MRKHYVARLIAIALMCLVVTPKFVLAQPSGWSPDINLTLDDNWDSRDQRIEVLENNIHIVWLDSRHYPITKVPEIYYKKSLDDGLTWLPEVRLTFIESSKDYLEMALNGDIIHLVWQDSREGFGTKIYYMNSTDGGNTWSSEKRISPSFGEKGDIAVGIGGKVHVVYCNDWQLNYINSTDNGLTWSETQILTGVVRDPKFPMIDVNGSNVHIVWEDSYDKSGNNSQGIYYLKSTDDGLSWIEEIKLSPNNFKSVYPDVAVYDDNVHVTYGENQGGVWNVYYRGSEDNGETWLAEFKISNSTEGISPSRIKANQNSVYILWADMKDPECEIYLRNSSDDGLNWTNEIRLTYDPEWSYGADFGFGDKSLHLIWFDTRDGAKEIYYKYYPYYPPPTNFTIDYWLSDLRLSWEPPQNSPSPVSHYHIYRSTTWDGFNFSTPWMDTSIDFDNGVIPLRTTWNDTFAYSDENNNYFYIVRAANDEDWNDTNTNIIGKYIIPLEKGWNLISLPLAQKDTNLSEVLRTIDGDYSIVQWYNAKESIWKYSTIDLTDINQSMGLWIHMINSTKLSIIGSLYASKEIPLYEGWNLVGYPSLKIRELNDALIGLNWQSVQCYDNLDSVDPWKHNNINKPENMNDLKEMKPGFGYWIFVSMNDTWVRTRTHDNNMVFWKIGEPSTNVVNQHNNEQINDDLIIIGEDDNRKEHIQNDYPITKDQENDHAISFIPLIFLFTLVFAEMLIFLKRYNNQLK